jgi:hypothetical protein
MIFTNAGNMQWNAWPQRAGERESHKQIRVIPQKFHHAKLYQENSDIAATIILGQKKLECTSLLIGQSTSCQALSDKEEYHPLLITQ